MIIAKKIRELRLEKGINRSTLANAINVHVRTISFWENEVNEPKASHVVALAEFFGVTTDYLLGTED